jgi:hypothetical protein
MPDMCRPFTREQLIASLLDEVLRAQTSFTAAQLQAWTQIAPGTALPATGDMLAVTDLTMVVDIEPCRDFGLARILGLGGRAGRKRSRRYRLCPRGSRRAIRLSIDLKKDGGRYKASVTELNPKGA